MERYFQASLVQKRFLVLSSHSWFTVCNYSQLCSTFATIREGYFMPEFSVTEDPWFPHAHNMEILWFLKNLTANLFSCKTTLWLSKGLIHTHQRLSCVLKKHYRNTWVLYMSAILLQGGAYLTSIMYIMWLGFL